MHLWNENDEYEIHFILHRFVFKEPKMFVSEVASKQAETGPLGREKLLSTWLKV